MPVRIPRARRTELLSFGIAGIGAFAPFYMLLPGAHEHVRSQTAWWAPHWERNVTFFVPAAEKTVQRVAPPVEKTVQRIDERLPLERVAKNVDKGIKKSIDSVGGLPKLGTSA